MRPVIWAAVAQAASPTPLESVRPLIGTADHGHVYPGATIPFGMVQLSPDTRTDGWDGCSGYHYPRDYVMGFSHTHLSGTGIGDMGDIRVTPISGAIPANTFNDGFHLRFSHADETAEPGRYKVTLADPKVEVELTATAHAGFHRYVFPADKPAHLVWDLVHGIGGGPRDASITIESTTVISGLRHTANWAKDKTFYFVAEFSRPFDSAEVSVGGRPSSDPKQGKGGQVTAHVDFKSAAEPVMVKVGLSPTSIEGARANLKAEIPAWDFAATVAAAKKSWADILDRIEIETGNAALRETFYTALYHSAMAPTLFNDADGAYRGIDRQVHKPEGFQNYSTFSLWDTFRAEHPLLTIVQPQRIDDFVNTMLAHQRQFNEHVLPVWPLACNETWCMIGNHAIPVILDAYSKGFHGFDAEAAYKAMRASVQDNTHGGMEEYRKLGYFASGGERVAKTVECAYDDWCVGQMAALLGQDRRRRDVHQAVPELPQRLRPLGRVPAGQVGRRPVGPAVRSGAVRAKRLHRRHLVELHLLHAPGRAGPDPVAQGRRGLHRQARHDVRPQPEAHSPAVPRLHRGHRPIRPRQRAVPPYPLPLQLRRRTVEVGEDPPRDHEHALQQQARRHLRQRRLRADVGVVRPAARWAFTRPTRPPAST